MLEKVDLSKKISKEEFKKIINELELKIGELQRESKNKKIPIIIVFEGWDAAGKGTLINRLILPLDPRGFNVYPTLPPNEEEKLRPFLWSFWIKTPAKGRITIFDRSWYKRMLSDKSVSYEDIKAFERQLTDDGTVIIKFFLHISKKEQKKRLKKLASDPATAWRVTKQDWKNHKKYNKLLKKIEEMIEKTDTENAPWTIVEAHDQRFATVKIFNTVIEAISNKINAKERIIEVKDKIIKPDHQIIEVKTLNSSILDKVDLSKSLTEEEYKEKLKEYQEKIRELEHKIYIKRIPIIILFEGWDAAGKGGNIRRLTQNMDPRGYEVIPIAAPNDIEKAHHYLWRFWMAIPKAGHIAIFDRTWYGRVLVERIEGFCKEEEWKRAYKEINELEAHLTNFGAILVKCWFHIDKDEQLRRFQERQNTPHKQWKITDEDWRNREKWDLYKEAVDEMLFRTSTTYAPWTIIESNNKLYGRIKTLKTIIKAAEKIL
ncbi:MAG TPA: polyphosphate:AMP phosphotransferase [bacterium]|nr:polyphosphate:AMP phosphotransferase [bacterium]HOL48891.1 polyphosphate:AMP phosphotransferase [bacterium]HPQ20133.1 polyphosphate:AMP phosphotransferase [bacterium]